MSEAHLPALPPLPLHSPISGIASEVRGVLSATRSIKRDSEKSTVSCTDIFSSFLCGGMRKPTIQIMERTTHGIIILNTCWIVCLLICMYTYNNTYTHITGIHLQYTAIIHITGG